jgi:hypothetical protein
MLVSCGGEPEDLLSPCVGAAGSPCDNRTPLNIQFRDDGVIKNNEAKNIV